MPGRGGARPPPPDSPRYPPRATELGPDAAADVVEGGDRGPRDGASFSSSAFCRTIAIAVAVATVAVVLGVVASSGGDGELLPGVGIKLPRWTYTAGGGGGGKRANPLTAAIVAHRARVRRARERVHHAAHDYARDDDDDDDDGDDDGDDGAGSTRGRRPRVLKDRRSPRERGRMGIRPEPGLVVLTTRSFGDATRGKTAIVLFRSVATPRVRNLRDAVLGSLKRHIPEGVVHVYGEVDVKDDSLLRMRYANAIHHAGRDEAPTTLRARKQKSASGLDLDDGGNGATATEYRFGRRRLLARQTQLSLFVDGLHVAVFRDGAATERNLAAWVTSELSRGKVVGPMSASAARAWAATATPRRPVVVGCEDGASTRALRRAAETHGGGHRDHGDDGGDERGDETVARVGFLSGAYACETFLGAGADVGDFAVFASAREDETSPTVATTVVAAKKAATAAEGGRGVRARPTPTEALRSVADPFHALSWENEYDLVASRVSGAKLKPTIALLRPPSAASGEEGTSTVANANANANAVLEAVRSLPPSDRRHVHWIVADATAYRATFHEPCEGGERDPKCPAFALTFSTPIEWDDEEKREEKREFIARLIAAEANANANANAAEGDEEEDEDAATEEPEDLERRPGSRAIAPDPENVGSTLREMDRRRRDLEWLGFLHTHEEKAARRKFALTRRRSDPPWNVHELKSELRAFVAMVKSRRGEERLAIAADKVDRAAASALLTSKVDDAEDADDDDDDDDDEEVVVDGDGDGGDGGEEEVAEDNKNASAPLKKKKTNAADELAWPSLRAPWDESSAPGEKHDLQSEILLRRDAAVARCDEWARYARHLREHVESLSPDTRSERRAIVDGAKAIDALVKRCGGRVVFESPREIEKLAQAGRWGDVLRAIEAFSGRNGRTPLRAGAAAAATRKSVSEMERAHDAIGPAFEKLIADAEAELVARRSNSTPLTVATVPVRTVHANELSLEDFIENHALPGVPVVIQGLNVTPPDAPRWTLKHFVDVCGDVNVTLNKKGADTDNWGGLVTAGRLTLREFVASHATDDDRKRWYLHDWSLNRECPDVFGPPPYDRFLVPKYFAGDYFQRVPWVSYEHTWPSLFVGAANTSSALHTDSGATNFWMYLLSGAKRWRFWPRTTSFHLYLKPMSSHYRVDAFNLNLTERPLLADAPMWEVTQRPGDLVFVPSNAPHAVHNDEDTVGISMNYVDASNVWAYLHDAASSEQWEDFENFDVETNDFGLSRTQGDVTFGEWKSSRRAWEGKVRLYRAERERRGEASRGKRPAPGEKEEDLRFPVWLD